MLSPRRMLDCRVDGQGEINLEMGFVGVRALESMLSGLGFGGWDSRSTMLGLCVCAFSLGFRVVGRSFLGRGCVGAKVGSKYCCLSSQFKSFYTSRIDACDALLNSCAPTCLENHAG